MMFTSILIATDGSDLAEKAVRQGLELARELRSKVTVLRVTPPSALATHVGAHAIPIPADAVARVAEIVREHLARIQAEAAATGVTCETLHVEDRLPWQAILDTAKSNGCDLIVMASHGRSGFSAAFLGSETHKVLAGSTIPVLVCR
jgi:nucleotide-binding universal stress UspA family protein